MQRKGDDIYIPSQDSYEIRSFIDGSILTISDAPWPGFTPDLLSIMLVVATQAKGSVLIHQKMFESRLFWVDKLIAMGGQIILCDPHRAVVSGPSPLRGAPVSSPDIRAGMALLIAALVVVLPTPPLPEVTTMILAKTVPLSFISGLVFPVLVVDEISSVAEYRASGRSGEYAGRFSNVPRASLRPA